MFGSEGEEFKVMAYFKFCVQNIPRSSSPLTVGPTAATPAVF